MFRKARSDYPRYYISNQIEIKESEVHGLGVFATRDIKKFELLESSPVIIFSRDTLKQLNDFYEVRHVLGEYPYAWFNGNVAIGLGHVSIYNHMWDSNAFWKANEEYVTMEFYARRDIEKGSEIFVKYTNHPNKLWFISDDEPEWAHAEYNPTVGAGRSSAFTGITSTQSGKIEKEKK